MWRENAVYDSVDLSRRAIRSIRSRDEIRREASAASPQATFIQVPVTPNQPGL
jgi:hypothetical protein